MGLSGYLGNTHVNFKTIIPQKFNGENFDKFGNLHHNSSKKNSSQNFAICVLFNTVLKKHFVKILHVKSA